MTIRPLVAASIGLLLCVASAMAGSHGGGGSGGSSGQTKPPPSAKPSVVGGALTAGKVAVPWAIFRK